MCVGEYVDVWVNKYMSVSGLVVRVRGRAEMRLSQLLFWGERVVLASVVSIRVCVCVLKRDSIV